MTQTNNRFLDELARLMTDAAGAAQGMRRDFETMMKAQGERMLWYPSVRLLRQRAIGDWSPVIESVRGLLQE